MSTISELFEVAAKAVGRAADGTKIVAKSADELLNTPVMEQTAKAAPSVAPTPFKGAVSEAPAQSAVATEAPFVAAKETSTFDELLAQGIDFGEPVDEITAPGAKAVANELEEPGLVIEPTAKGATTSTTEAPTIPTFKLGDKEYTVNEYDYLETFTEAAGGNQQVGMFLEDVYRMVVYKNIDVNKAVDITATFYPEAKDAKAIVEGLVSEGSFAVGTMPKASTQGAAIVKSAPATPATDYRTLVRSTIGTVRERGYITKQELNAIKKVAPSKEGFDEFVFFMHEHGYPVVDDAAKAYTKMQEEAGGAVGDASTATRASIAPKELFKTTPAKTPDLDTLPSWYDTEQKIKQTVAVAFDDALKQLGHKNPEVIVDGVSDEKDAFEVYAYGVSRSDEQLKKEAFDVATRRASDYGREATQEEIDNQFLRLTRSNIAGSKHPVAVIRRDPATNTVHMDIGVSGKTIKGTGEGAAMYNALYSTANKLGIKVEASSVLTPGNTVLKNINMASGIYKLGKSDFVEANVQQFAPFIGAGLPSNDYGNMLGAIDSVLNYAKKSGGKYGELDESKLADWESYYTKEWGASEDDLEAAQATVDLYNRYWGVVADGSDAQVTSTRTNNLLASFFHGVYEGVNTYAGRAGSASQRSVAEEVNKRLGGGRHAFRRALVDVGSLKNDLPILSVLKEMAQEEKWQKILPVVLGATLVEDLLGSGEGSTND